MGLRRKKIRRRLRLELEGFQAAGRWWWPEQGKDGRREGDGFQRGHTGAGEGRLKKAGFSASWNVPVIKLPPS